MAQNLQVCEIEPDVVKKVNELKFRKEKNNFALMLKVNTEKRLVVLDEEYEDISIEDLQSEIPDHLPSYIVLSYVYSHDDGRVSYPFCFIFVSPQGCKPEIHMMYAGTKTTLVNQLGITKVFEVRSSEDVTEEWLREKLKFFR